MSNSSSNHSERSNSETSRTILDLIRKQDPEAWQRFVHLYSPLVYDWCRRLNLPEQDMPDLFQEIFHTVSKKISSFSHTDASSTFRGWLRVLVRNKIIDHYRKQQKEPSPIGGTDAQLRFEQIPFDTIAEAEELQSADDVSDVYGDLFQRGLAEIKKHFSDQTWQAFWGMVVDGKSAQEVGEQLSMRPGTVRVAKSRVLQRLRKELGDQY